MIRPQLTICMATMPARIAKHAPSLLKELELQAIQQPVQLLCLYDNLSYTLGMKRNLLLNMSQGLYTTFVDDDDRVAFDYVPTLLQAIESACVEEGTFGDPLPDVINFHVGYSKDDGPLMPVYYGLQYDNVNHADRFERKPNHLMAWRTDLAKTVPYEDRSGFEDTPWANAISQLTDAEKQYSIDKTLYYYQDRTRPHDDAPFTDHSGMHRWLDYNLH